jgi:hypothetical protein
MRNDQKSGGDPLPGFKVVLKAIFKLKLCPNID